VGAAFSRDLPGQSRLKTAPTIKNNRFKTTKFLSRSDWTLVVSGGAYMKHHLLQKCSFFLIKLAAVQASGWADT